MENCRSEEMDKVEQTILNYISVRFNRPTRVAWLKLNFRSCSDGLFCYQASYEEVFGGGFIDFSVRFDYLYYDPNQKKLVGYRHLVINGEPEQEIIPL